MSSYSWSPLDTASGGVPIYANFAAFPTPASVPIGSLAVDASTGKLYENNGTSWQVIGGPGAALAIGPIDTEATPSANGATISGNALIMQSASATAPGLVNLTTQSFAGNKTFTGAISASNLSGTNTGDVTIGTANGLSLSLQALSLALSSTSTVGALSAADWNTFNGKQNALTLTNLTDTGTDGIAITNGTGAVIGASPVTIAQHVADTTHNGYLSSTDWNTFNGKQPAGTYVTAVSIASANGFAGSSSGGATPALTITVPASGIIRSNGTAIGAATAGTDYSLGTSALATGILKSTTGTGALTIAVAGDFPTLNQNTTGSAGSVSGTNVVTLANLVQAPTLTLLGNNTGGTANYVNLTVSQVNTMLGSLSNPMTTGGDMIYGGTAGLATRLANGTSGQYLASSGGTTAPTWTTFKVPTIQRLDTTARTFTVTSANATVGATYTNNTQTFTVVSTIAAATSLTMTGTGASLSSGTLTKATGTGDATITFSAVSTTGSGTYTLPAGCLYIEVEAQGGGGGGGGSGTAVWPTGGTGNSTTFGSSLITAGGGSPGSGASNIVTAGGSSAVASPAVIMVAIAGGSGDAQQVSTTGATGFWWGGGGGHSFYGGGGARSVNAIGQAGLPTTGGGGSGGGVGNGAGASGGVGGAAGAYVRALIGSPSATYAFSVGTGGSGGGAGTSGAAGGAGGSGILLIKEFYS